MNDELSNTSTYDQRFIRVFVSSTFRDMQTERDYLVRVVFPELKERCAKRGLHLIDVDLRWGVTEAKQGKVIGIYLNLLTSGNRFLENKSKL